MGNQCSSALKPFLAKLVPAQNQPEDTFGCLTVEIKIVGDIESPVVPWEDGDALR
jgi:hypothetical protein